MTKEILFGKDSRAKMLIGIQKLAQAVKVTVGASGKCVLIGEAVYGNDGLVHLPTKVSKDGWTVCRHFSLPDVVENRGAMMLTEAATKTMEVAGDATSCTIVLAEALITGGMKLVEEGANSQQLKKGMDAALEYVVKELKEISTPVKGNIERIRQVATVSANNDKVIGDLIAECYEKIGDEGIIDIEKSSGVTTDIKLFNGYQFERGWVSPLFVNNRSKESCEFENPLILLYQNRINHHTQFKQAIDISAQTKRPLLIICEDAEGEGLAILTMNNYQQNIRVCVVKSPSFGEAMREGMEDIALLTGGTYISDTRGIDIKEVELSHFGGAKKVIVSKDETIIIDGEGQKENIDKFISDLRETLVNAKSEEEKSPIEKRIARISGSIAVIQVGAATETELYEKMDRVDDAVRATKAAIAEGFVIGGGGAFLKIGRTLFPNPTFYNQGFNLVMNILNVPFKQICENAGVDPNPLIDEIISTSSIDDAGKRIDNRSYNVLTEKIEDMEEAGIIDSTKALRCALTNAVSVAGMVLTSECSIITIH